MKKRIASFLLAAVMLIGVMILPTTAASTPFKDVKEGKWYTKPIKYVYDNKLMNGMTDTIFEPDSPMTRSMLVTVLWRVEDAPKPGGKTPFTDLKMKWYMDAVAWAYENSIVKGTSEKAFSPNTSITREQIATIFFRYAEFAGRDTSAKADLTAFPDGAKVAKYAKAAMSWAVGEGLITGTKVGDKNYLDPKGNATRAQVATILERYLEAAPKSLSDRIDGKLEALFCYNHDDLNIQFGNSATLTEESLNACLGKIFGCKVEVGEGINELFDRYVGAGNGGICWADEDVETTFTDESTGETYSRTIGYAIRKDLYAKYTGAVESGELTWCPDDRPDEITDALYVMESYEGETVTVKEGPQMYDDVEAMFRTLTGLNDASRYVFYHTAIDDPNGFIIDFKYYDPSEGRTYTVGAKLNLDLEPMTVEEKLEVFFDEYRCPIHPYQVHMALSTGKIFKEQIPIILMDAIGLDPEIYELEFEEDEFNRAANEVAGEGEGQIGGGVCHFCVVNKLTGEKTEMERIDFAVRKLLGSGLNSMYVCHELADVWKPAESVFTSLICEDESHEDEDGDLVEQIHAVFRSADLYTEENVKAMILETAGLDVIPEVILVDFDPARIGDGSIVGFFLKKDYGTYVDMTRCLFFTASVDPEIPVDFMMTAEHQSN